MRCRLVVKDRALLVVCSCLQCTKFVTMIRIDAMTINNPLHWTPLEGLCVPPQSASARRFHLFAGVLQQQNVPTLVVEASSLKK